MDRVRSRDSASGLNALVDSLLPLKPRVLRRLRLRFGCSAEDAEDLFQDALLCTISSATDPRNLQAWFLTIVRNLAVSHLRRRKNATKLFGKAPREYQDQPTRQGRFDIQGLIADLPPAQRLALEHLCIFGETSTEVSQALGISPESVRKAASRAKLTPRKNLARKVSQRASSNRHTR